MPLTKLSRIIRMFKYFSCVVTKRQTTAQIDNRRIQQKKEFSQCCCDLLLTKTLCYRYVALAKAFQGFTKSTYPFCYSRYWTGLCSLLDAKGVNFFAKDKTI